MTEQICVGKRAAHTIAGRTFMGTIVKVTTRSVRIVYDDGVTVTMTTKKERPGPLDAPSCLASAGWVVLPWSNMSTVER